LESLLQIPAYKLRNDIDGVMQEFEEFSY